MSVFSKCERCDKFIVGAETVTISVLEYEKLKRESAAAGHSQRLPLKYRAFSNSSIARNRELADFLVEHFDQMTIAELHSAAVSKFGSVVPSRSSVHRFISAVAKLR